MLPILETLTPLRVLALGVGALVYLLPRDKPLGALLGTHTTSPSSQAVKAVYVSLALGAGFVYWAVVLLLNRNPRAPMETFKYSIVYLGLLFVVLLGDHYVFDAASAGALELGGL